MGLMSDIKMLHSDEEVKQFIEESIAKDTHKQERVMTVLMWLTYNSLQVKVWNN